MAIQLTRLPFAGRAGATVSSQSNVHLEPLARVHCIRRRHTISSIGLSSLNASTRRPSMNSISPRWKGCARKSFFRRSGQSMLTCPIWRFWLQIRLDIRFCSYPSGSVFFFRHAPSRRCTLEIGPATRPRDKGLKKVWAVLAGLPACIGRLTDFNLKAGTEAQDLNWYTRSRHKTMSRIEVFRAWKPTVRNCHPKKWGVFVRVCWQMPRMREDSS